MKIIKFIPVVLSALFVSAHFYRVGNMTLVAVVFASLGLLFVKKAWVPIVIQFLLIIAALLWVQVGSSFVAFRISYAFTWVRMALILGSVSLFTAASSLVFFTKSMKTIYRNNINTQIPSAIAFIIVAILLSIVHVKIETPMLLAQRFISGGGWIEIFILSFYAAWITEKMLDISQSAKWRKRIWILFSVVFFLQLFLGLAGFDSFLMSGKLHLPVPAVILAGPIYRLEGFFMPILFIFTALLVGPAWCSHLCYMGALDQFFAERKKIPNKIYKHANKIKVLIFALVIIAAVFLKAIGASMLTAIVLSLIFGILGVGVSVFLSRKSGIMIHCTVYCPIGLAANVLGKLSPFRLKILNGCDMCGACKPTCRVGALETEHLKRKKTGYSCTLCTDCISKCKKDQLVLSFGKWQGHKARVAYIILVVSFHAIFLGVARI